jgi:hypothetical protein
MNNFLIKYFEIAGFILWWIVWLSINRITDFVKINIWFSIIVFIICIILFIYWFITKNKLISFEYNLEKWKRRKENIYDKEVRICENNPIFQIKKWDDYWEFTEPRTQVYPDNNWSGKYTVELITNGVITKTLFWVYCDWWRISVPIPKQEVLQKSEKMHDIEVKYYWNKNSIEFKVGKIIWEFYIYKNIEWIARVSKIEIR